MGENADPKYMQIVLKLAAKGRGRTSPNPMVGAVIVRNDEIVGQGYHKKAGEPHAEINAITAAGKKARGGTLYVNLEPCNHYGRTPPCTEAILAAGIRRMVIGMCDPNPDVKGGGVEFLQFHGVKVAPGILEKECRHLNEAYIKYVTEKRPFVIMKAAASMDGKIATRSGDAKWITGEKARRFVHRLRNEVDAILVGAGTVLKDDPRLTTRLEKKGSRYPVRVILDSRLKIPLSAKIFSLYSPAPTLVVTSHDAPKSKKKHLIEKGIDVISVSNNQVGLDFKELLSKLGKKGIVSVLVEGGGAIFGSIIQSRLVDKFYLFYAPIIIGGTRATGTVGGKGVSCIADAFRLRDMRIRKIGEDLLVEAYPAI